MRSALIIIILLIPVFNSAQNVEWADSVLGFSTQNCDPRFPGQRSAKQILGKPNRIPGSGNCFSAWSALPSKNGSVEWIKVGFNKPMQIQQVAVFETHYPGSISRIFAYDETDHEYLVYENLKPGPPDVPGRIYYLFMPLTSYKVASLKLELLPHFIPAPAQIDAIAISDSKDSIRVEINIAPNVGAGGFPENMGELINSYSDELNPTISPDGRTLFFTRQGHKENIAVPENQDIWFSVKGTNGKFGLAKNIGIPLNNKDDNSIASVMPDGQTAMVNNIYRPNGTIEKGVSFTKRVNGKWTVPDSIIVENYYNKNVFGEHCLSVSGKILVMTVQRDDAIGSKDIYVSFLKEEGTWTEPKNLGPILNTAESEVSPFLAADEVTLYFSTSGWPGYGKNDMFITRRLDDTWTHWTEPENLGPILNSSAWDGYYTIPASGDYAYFVSGNKSFGKQDIYRAKLPSTLRPNPVVLVRGIVRDKKTNLPLSAEVDYENLMSGLNEGIAHSEDSTGKYTIILAAGEIFGFLPIAPGYIGLNENLDLTEVNSYKEINKDLFLVPIEVGQVVRMNNVFFDFGKSTLRPESKPELLRLATFLKMNPSVEIEISGHTDNVGEDQSNLLLSQHRAASVFKYLISQGIPEIRMKNAGYGETKPGDSNETPEGRQNNRRVEFLILKVR